MNDINNLSSRKQGRLPRSPHKTQHKRKDVHILIRLFFLVLSFFVVCLFVFYVYTTQFSSQDASSRILKEVSKLAVLPPEEASLFRISNTEVLMKESSFFKDAKKEDILLIFSGAKKFILYRPGEKKVVAMGPLKEDSPLVVRKEVYSVPSSVASSSVPVTTEKVQN